MAQKNYSSSQQSSEIKPYTELVLVSREPLLYLKSNKLNKQNVYGIKYNSFNKFNFSQSRNNCWHTDWCREYEKSKHHFLKSVKIDSREQSTTHYSSRSSVSHLKGDSGIISNWFENRRPQRTQNSTVTSAPFRSKLESNGHQVDRIRKFLERIFSTRAILKAISKLFGSLDCSDGKNWLDLSNILWEATPESSLTVAWFS